MLALKNSKETGVAVMNEGNVEGDEVGEGCRADFIPRVLGSYWEVESRAMTSFDKIPVH